MKNLFDVSKYIPKNQNEIMLKNNIESLQMRRKNMLRRIILPKKSASVKKLIEKTGIPEQVKTAPQESKLPQYTGRTMAFFGGTVGAGVGYFGSVFVWSFERFAGSDDKFKPGLTTGATAATFAVVGYPIGFFAGKAAIRMGVPKAAAQVSNMIKGFIKKL